MKTAFKAFGVFSICTLAGLTIGIVIAWLAFAVQGDGAIGEGLIMIGIIALTTFLGCIVGLIKINDMLIQARQTSSKW